MKKVLSALIFFLAIFTLLILPRLSEAAQQLILEYKLDEGSGTIANDTSGSGNNGNLIGPPTWISGKFSSALEFKNLNSPEDYVNGGSNASLDNLPQGDFTIENWVKFPVTPTSSYFGILNKIGTPGGENGWWLNINWKAGGIWELYYYGRMLNGTKANSTANIAVQLNKWHHIAMVYSATTKKAKLYFDGDEVTYTRQGSGSGTPADDSAGNLIVGRYRTTNFPHRIDDLHIYDYARSAEQIAYGANIVNVKEFGAIGDGVTEDQVAFQAAVDYLKANGGGRLYVPTGTYILHKTTPGWNGTFNMIAAEGIEMFGDSNTASILKRKNVTPIGDTHIVRIINSNNISVHDLGFDGSRETGNQDQMHGVYVLNSNNITLEKLKITRFRGSGTYLIGGNDAFCSSPPCKDINITIKDSIFDDNYRAGSANQGGIENISYLNNIYSNTGPGQALDFEPTGSRLGAKNVTITGNNFGSSGGSYIISLAGNSATLMAQNFSVSDNTMNGGVLIGKMDGMTFSDNTVNGGGARSLDIKTAVKNLTVTNNHLESSGIEAIHLVGTNVSNIEFSGNNIYQLATSGGSNTEAGIYSEGVGQQDFKVLNNNFVGPVGGTTNRWGVYFRNIMADDVTRTNFQVNGNKFWRMPNQIKMSTNDVNTKYQDVDISDNIYYYNGGGNFGLAFSPTDPATFIINLTTNNNTVQPEIPDP